ncbi:hypothetical protein [Microlunatus speluncae]|uniref:hypothetical protein n=1 Tax=Microlunatus speluncae TaxID=2594267 RepID=UPI0012664F04|nr:hypothetical protein [Microlunatus speluncae]
MGKPNPLLVILTAIWRLGIAICAFSGWWLYGHDPAELPFLTQSGNLLVSIVYLGLAVYYPVASLATGKEPGSGKLRGAMTLLMIVVGCTYVGVMGGDIGEPKDLLTHVVTPWLVFLDWCFVGRSQNRTRWWHPFLWIIVPGVWLIGYSITGGYRWVRGSSPLYGFADPRDGDYGAILIGLVFATIAGGYLLYGIGKLKGVLSRAVRGESAPTRGPQPGPRPYPGQQPPPGRPPYGQQPPHQQPPFHPQAPQYQPQSQYQPHSQYPAQPQPYPPQQYPPQPQPQFPPQPAPPPYPPQQSPHPQQPPNQPAPYPQQGHPTQPPPPPQRW